MNVIIYSANFGQYDSFKDSSFLEDVTSCYLTDHEIPENSNWEQVLVDTAGEDPKRLTGYYKTNSHILPPHDVSIWMDASLRLKRSLNPLIAEFAQSEAQIMIPRHNCRTCTYTEAVACKELKKDTPALIDSQMERYSDEGLPPDFGMVGTMMIFRKNTPSVRLFNKFWHREIVKGSRRDQLSVMYTSWKTGIPIKQIDMNIYKNSYFKPHRHLKK